MEKFLVKKFKKLSPSEINELSTILRRETGWMISRYGMGAGCRYPSTGFVISEDTYIGFDNLYRA